MLKNMANTRRLYEIGLVGPVRHGGLDAPLPGKECVMVNTVAHIAVKK